MSYLAIETRLIRGKSDYLVEKRKKRIIEAMQWKGGTREHPNKYVVDILPGDVQVYFLKPGKEVFNKLRPNPYDMTPCVGSSSKRFTFNEIWTYLSKISIIDFDAFKVILTLIYRDAFMLDHIETGKNMLRYRPEEKIFDIIRDMDSKFAGSLPIKISELLYFLDILGWNEDMKYHIENNVPTFEGKYGFNVGRINTLLTCIRVPYQASSFVRHAIEQNRRGSEIDFAMLYTIMQQFANSRGTCVPTRQNLIEWLSPYIID